MRTRGKLALSLTVVSMVLGFMVALQYKQTENASALGIGAGTSIAANKRLANELRSLKQSNGDEEAQLADITAKVSSYEKKSSGPSNGLDSMEKLLQDERILAGVSPVYGPGITVTLMDGGASGSDVEQVLTHDWNVRSVMNELFTAGAEAVSINGYRVVATSGVFCRGPVVTVNDHRLGAPFVLNAIGDPETLKSALDIQGGILDLMRSNGLRISDPSIVSRLEMPAYTGAVQAQGTVN
jgi:uncharacterized protein YlxW (UPF0749 family)